MKRIFRTTCAFAILRRCGAAGSFIITGRLKTEIERGGTKLVTITLACGTERCNERFHMGNKGGTELRFRSLPRERGKIHTRARVKVRKRWRIRNRKRKKGGRRLEEKSKSKKKKGPSKKNRGEDSKTRWLQSAIPGRTFSSSLSRSSIRANVSAFTWETKWFGRVCSQTSPVEFARTLLDRKSPLLVAR